MTPRGYRVSWTQNRPVTMTSACVSDIFSFWIDGYKNVSLMISREKKKKKKKGKSSIVEG